MSAGGNSAETHFAEWWHPSRVIIHEGQEIRDWVALYRRIGYFDLLAGKGFPDEYDDWDIFSQEGYEHGRAIALETLVQRIDPKWSADRAVPDAYYNHKAILDRLPAYRTLRHASKARQDNENQKGYFVRRQLPVLEAVLQFVRDLIGVEVPDGSPVAVRHRTRRIRKRVS